MPVGFATSYAQSARDFIAICGREGIDWEQYHLDLAGPAGEWLATRVAYVGPPDCQRLLILNCGTHGVEGLAGSACLLAWLADRHSSATDEVGVLLVHFINPWGTAWRRRQTEGNVDLNRNFVDFAAPLPPNELYEELRAALTPASIEGDGWARAQRQIEDFRRTRGDAALAEAVFRGQYGDQAGPGFGGNQPAWSNLTFRTLVARYAGHARHVGFIDFHTGLGPFAHGTLLSAEPPESPELVMAARWYGSSVVSLKAPGRQMPYDIQGDIASAVRQALPRAEVVAVSLEFGTFDLDRFMDLQIRDCWLLKYGSPGSPQAERIRCALQDFFCPPTRDWQEAIVARGTQVIRQAIAGLAAIT